MAWKTEYIGDKEENAEDKEYELWNPEDGDVLQGTVTNMEKGEWGKQTLYINPSEIEGQEDIIGTIHKTREAGGLDWQIGKLKIQIGDVIHLTYNGLKDLGKLDKNGEPMYAHDYKLMKWEEEE